MSLSELFGEMAGLMEAIGMVAANLTRCYRRGSPDQYQSCQTRI